MRSNITIYDLENVDIVNTGPMGYSSIFSFVHH
jgi:hypothetical protein